MIIDDFLNFLNIFEKNKSTKIKWKIHPLWPDTPDLFILEMF